jgi:hypothetical protein
LPPYAHPLEPGNFARCGLLSGPTILRLSLVIGYSPHVRPFQILVEICRFSRGMKQNTMHSCDIGSVRSHTKSTFKESGRTCGRQGILKPRVSEHHRSEEKSDYRTKQSQRYSPEPRNVFRIVQTIDELLGCKASGRSAVPDFQFALCAVHTRLQAYIS